ncbi:hypothetical protein PROFUN_17014, partial [Planoprotostelium fungivorum]
RMREYLRYRSEKFPQNSPASPDALALLWLNLYLLSNTVILINTVQSMLKMSVIEKCVGGVPLVCSKHALGTPKFVNHLQIFVLVIKMCVESTFLADDSRNTTLKAHPHAPISHATVWQGYYHLRCSVFHPVCIKHALGTQKLINVLQRIYKLIIGSKHSVLHKTSTEHTNAYKCFAEDYQTEHRRQAFSARRVVEKWTIIFPFTMMGGDESERQCANNNTSPVCIRL